MSTNYADYPVYYNEYGETVMPELVYAPRSKMQALWFIPPAVLSGLSWMGDGVAPLTDLSFIVLSLACVAMLIEEMANFPRRFGLGGITLFGGVLIWFCHDYFTNWFWFDFQAVSTMTGPGGQPLTALVLAKSAFLHHFFIIFAVAALQLPVWGWLERALGNIPEPASDGFYLPLIVLCFLVGMIPYTFFAAYPLPIALWKEITGGRADGGVFTVGRTGNVNQDFGAYLAQIQQVGQVGALLALFYVLLMRPGILTKLFCIAYWLLYVGLAFGSGTRGHTAYMAMPILFVVFMKYQSQAAAMFKRISYKAYIWSGVVALAILVLLQIQITFRNVGFNEMKLEEVKTGIEGNSMFSEALSGMALIPEQKPFFYSRIPGQGALMCLPEVAWRFLYGPIPRAVWKGKPIDPVWKWYNSVITGRPEDQLEGTTVSTGLVGDFYFRFGMAGVIEGGLLFGFLCLVGERSLQNSQGRLIQLVFSIGFLVFMFRSFRGLNFITLYPLLIGVTFLVIIIKLTGARQPAYSAPQE
jgi:hypothetical protein